MITLPDWNTDLRAAPRGERMLVAMWNYDHTAAGFTTIGILLFEPAEREADDDEDSEFGWWGEHDGVAGMWCWHAEDEGYTETKCIAAWMPLPPSFEPPVAAEREDG